MGRGKGRGMADICCCNAMGLTIVILWVYIFTGVYHIIASVPPILKIDKRIDTAVAHHDQHYEEILRAQKGQLLLPIFKAAVCFAIGIFILLGLKMENNLFFLIALLLMVIGAIFAIVVIIISAVVYKKASDDGNEKFQLAPVVLTGIVETVASSFWIWIVNMRRKQVVYAD